MTVTNELFQERIIKARTPSKSVLIGCDVGAAFIDIFLFNQDTGQSYGAKVPTSGNPLGALQAALRSTIHDMSSIVRFGHSLSLSPGEATKCDGSPVAFVTTTGLRDIIEVEPSVRSAREDRLADRQCEQVRRRDRFTVPERVDAFGEVIVELDEVEARRVAQILARRKFTKIAVCFTNAPLNPRNELRMRDLIQSVMPDAYVAISSESGSSLSEYRRFTETIKSASKAPALRDYLDTLRNFLKSRDFVGPILFMGPHGGGVTAEITAQPIHSVARSQVVAGAVANLHVASTTNASSVLSIDIGGQTTDVTICPGGRLPATPISAGGTSVIGQSVVDAFSIDIGGASMVWVDATGSVKIGPHSANADPGPACYGRGGAFPTLTDAQVVLGRIGPSLAGGRIQLDRGLAAQAIQQHVSARARMTIEQAALAIIRVAEATIQASVALQAVWQDVDLSEFTLVASGGAGPLHAIEIAKALGIEKVVIPPLPGINSASAGLLVNLSSSRKQVISSRLRATDLVEVDLAFRSLEADVTQALRAAGESEGEIEIERSLTARIVGTSEVLTVAVRPDNLKTDRIAAAVMAGSRSTCTSSQASPEILIHEIAVSAQLAMPKAALLPLPSKRQRETRKAQPTDYREVYLDDASSPVECAVYDRTDFVPGMAIQGPCIIEQFDSTIFLTEGLKARVDSNLSLVIALRTSIQ